MSLIVLIRLVKTNIELLPLKNGSSSAPFKGILTLKHTTKGPRPFKFKLINGKTENIRAPGEAIELLRTADLILVSKNSDSASKNDILMMLDGYNLGYEFADVCRICISEGRFSQIDSNSIRYRGDFICENCAISELHREITLGSKRMAEEGIERLVELLLRTRDLDRMLVFLNPGKMDLELTLFDRVNTSKYPQSLEVRDLKIDQRLKKILPPRLLPVQSISIRSGLLENQNQLVVSATATGKTLIGEMAGLNNLLSGSGKMLFLVPLVALANQKSDQFTRRYGSLGITTGIRVGQSRIKMQIHANIPASLDSDIIVGTYEGIDHVLRSGGVGRLGRVGTIVMDEVHMIEDPERGPRLDGLIARLRYLYPRCQFIFLSATVGNPRWLAENLGSLLVEYEERPVPLERHVLFGGDSEKLRLINQLAREEYNRKSSKGFKGQTIIFTNSRRKCHRLAQSLNMPSAAYHAGLPYRERRRIEDGFARGKIPVVVTTAALAAGVDFPASQVIFESLAMGNDWLTQGEFLQMQGRAGRPDYHDRGIVVVMAEPDKRFGKGEGEEKVAIKLLQGEMGPINIEYDEDSGLEQVLASAAIWDDKQDIRKVESLRLGGNDVDFLLDKLHAMNYVDLSHHKIRLTEMGRIMITHYLNPEQMSVIKDGIMSEYEPADILTQLEIFDRVFFKNSDRMTASLNINLSSKVFQGAAMEMALSHDSLEKLDSSTRKKLIHFASDFLTCTCRETPYCGCPERKFTKRLLEMRCDGLGPDEIIDAITADYGIFAYAADVLDFLETSARHLEAMVKITKVHGAREAEKRSGEFLKCIIG